MSEYPTPERFPHPCGGEIEECVRTPEIRVSREWRWRSYCSRTECHFIQSGGEAQLYFNGGTSIAAGTSSFADEFLLWEMEVDCGNTTPDISKIRGMVGLSEGYRKVVEAPLESLYRKQSRPNSLFWIVPHPYRLSFNNMISIGLRVNEPRSVPSSSSMAIYLHGYHGLFIKKDGPQ